MTVQEIKSMLNSVRVKYREYTLAEEKAERFREMISYSSAGISDAPPHEHGDNMTEKKYINALIYCEEANEKFRRYMQIRHDAELMIEQIRYPDEREVLTRRYIMYQKWEEIADKMFISLRQIHRLHGKGLVSISERCH